MHMQKFSINDPDPMGMCQIDIYNVNVSLDVSHYVHISELEKFVDEYRAAKEKEQPSSTQHSKG